MSSRGNRRQITITSAARTPPAPNKLTLALLVILAPLAVALGLLVSCANAASRVLGHRGPLLSRFKSTNASLRSRKSVIARSSKNLQIQPRKIPRVLITGSGPLALAIARALKQRGSYVVVCDAEKVVGGNRMRYSRAVGEFISLDQFDLWNSIGFRKRFKSKLNTAEFLQYILRSRKIDAWIPLGGAVRKEDVIKVRKSTDDSDCRVLYPTAGDAQSALDRQELESFVASLNTGIKTPTAIQVNTRGEIHRLLAGSLGHRKYALVAIKPTSSRYQPQWRDSGFSEPSHAVAVKDTQRTSDSNQQSTYVVPLESLDKTYDFLATVSVTPQNPWLVSEILVGKICQTFCMIQDGKMQAYTALISSHIVVYPGVSLAHIGANAEYRPPCVEPVPVSQNSALNKALAAFTETYIAALERSTTGPLQLTFLLEEKQAPYGSEGHLWAVACNFEIPAAVLPWDDSIKDISTSILRQSQTSELTLTAKVNTVPQLYSLPSDMLSYLLVPILQLLTFQINFATLTSNIYTLITHILYYKEELFDLKDPAPWLWYWLVEQPLYTTNKLFHTHFEYSDYLRR